MCFYTCFCSVARVLQRARAKLRPAARSALVLPAKSQSGFLESIYKNTGEIQQLTAGKSPSEYKKVFCSDESYKNSERLPIE